MSLRRSSLSLLALMLAGSSTAQTPISSGPAPGVDLAALDRSANACVDFYQFACGGWRQAHPIPADESRWGRFNELIDRNRTVLRELLEIAARPEAKRSPVERQVGDAYAACMDEAGIEARGQQPLASQLADVKQLTSKAALPATLARLHQNGVAALFNFGAAQDFKQAEYNLATLDQGGLGLPDRDYYLSDEARFRELRQKYQAHVERSLALTGLSAAEASIETRAVLEVETALARLAMPRVERRNPLKRYNKRSLGELEQLGTTFNWPAYFKAAGAPTFAHLNVSSLPFFEGLDAQLQALTLEQLQSYLRWQILRAAAPLLPKAFADLSFDFYGRSLTGATEQLPRGKRCADLVDNNLGEALGQLYVARAFPAQSQTRMQQLVADVERALERDLDTLPWMTAETRAKAKLKLSAISNKVGYPKTWRDYSAVAIRRDDALGNDQRATAFEWARDMRKIGQLADRQEWTMTPPTVNAYYQPLNNSINFPAGILQTPFFDGQRDDAVNYGAIGAVIGHELTHGFDDSGRKFAGDGNLTDWWSEADATEFERRTQCLVDQYGSYTAVDDVKLNGQLTLGENTADNGGVRVALMALESTLEGKAAELREGFTPQQRFFLGYAQIWCQNVRPEAARLRAQTDPHSSGEWRVNGVVANSPEFAKAFACQPGQAMVRENACRVW